MPLIWTAILLACSPHECRRVELGWYAPQPVCLLAAQMVAADWIGEHPGFAVRRLDCEAGEVGT